MLTKNNISLNNDILNKEPSRLNELDILLYQNYVSSYIYKIIDVNIENIENKNHFKYFTGEKSKYIDNKTLRTLLIYL